MNENMAVVFISVTILVGLWGIVDSVLKRWAQIREKQIEMAAGHHAERSARQDDLVQELALRVQVLERIVTDRSTTLAAEIDDLRGSDERKPN